MVCRIGHIQKQWKHFQKSIMNSPLQRRKLLSEFGISGANVIFGTQRRYPFFGEQEAQ
jgi:hypothetical protein